MNRQDKDNIRLLRILVYVYLGTILYDGILRKWLLVSLSAPLMMIKQVVAVVIFLVGVRYWTQMRNWEKSFFFIGVCVFFTTLLFGHHNLIVAIYGCLPYWFGLPVCFIIGQVLNYYDLIRIGKLLVYTSIVNSLLLILQFNLPITHFLNYQGGEVEESIIGYTISSLQGGFRPSGLFLHNTQNGMFQMISLSYILYFLFWGTGKLNKNLLNIALILDLISLPFTVSRTNIFYQIGVLIFFSIFCLDQQHRVKVIRRLPLLALALFLATYVPIFNSAMNTLSARFSDASQSQFSNVSTTTGTLMDLYNRNIVYNVEAILRPRTLDGESVPFWGFGQGMSTQVGGRLLGVTKNSGFALAEWDGLRIMCESGYLFGWSIIFIRIAFSFRYLFRVQRMRKKHNNLSLILLPVFLVSFYLLNNWGNLFLSNFSFLIGGIFLASLRFRIYMKKPQSHDEINMDSAELISHD